MKGKRQLARKIANAIEADLNDRKGLHINNLDEEIQEEIRREWRAKILKVLRDEEETKHE
jgi:hypothetical protein